MKNTKSKIENYLNNEYFDELYFKDLAFIYNLSIETVKEFAEFYDKSEYMDGLISALNILSEKRVDISKLIEQEMENIIKEEMQINDEFFLCEMCLSENFVVGLN